MTTGDLSTTFSLDTDLVVDAAYFTVAEIRAEYPELADTARYPDVKIDTVRERAEHAFEDAAGIAFIPRDTTETLDGTGGNVLLLRWPRVRSVTTITDETGTAVDSTSVRATGAGIYAPTAWTEGVANLTVTYTHGYNTPPLRVKQAVMLLTKVWLIKGPLDDRLTSLSTDDGTFSLLTPGVRGSVFGIPEVDATLAQYRVPVIA